jgi:hypothetical protein
MLLNGVFGARTDDLLMSHYAQRISSGLLVQVSVTQSCGRDITISSHPRHVLCLTCGLFLPYQAHLNPLLLESALFAVM